MDNSHFRLHNSKKKKRFCYPKIQLRKYGVTSCVGCALSTFDDKGSLLSCCLIVLWVLCSCTATEPECYTTFSHWWGADPERRSSVPSDRGTLLQRPDSFIASVHSKDIKADIIKSLSCNIEHEIQPPLTAAHSRLTQSRPCTTFPGTPDTLR